MKKGNVLLIGTLLILVCFSALFLLTKEKEFVAKTPRKRLLIKPMGDFDINFEAEKIQLFNSSIYLLNFSGYRIVKLNSIGKPEQNYVVESKDTLTKPLIISFDVDSLGVYIAEVNNKELFFFGHDGKMQKVHNPDLMFSRAKYIGQQTYVTKAFDKNMQDDEVFFVDMKNQTSNEYGEILKDYNDGGMATDGFFLNNPNGIIAHVSYKMSDIILFNKKGEVTVRGRTIDKYQTPPEVIRTSTEFTMPANAITVNKSGFIDHKFLYILSNIRSEAETKEDFDANSIIDVYSIDGLEYQFSYYVPDAENGNVIDFAVANNILYTIQGKRIFKYKL